ncbi:MAG: response regulator transcription factor [Bacteroidota bacterium]
MISMKAIAVDDEHLALDLVERYIADTPSLDLTGRFQSAPEAVAAIQRERPDILFLDIQMPGLSGLNLLHALASPPVTIFTTAYPDYAVNAFELDVVDYLLKPFSFDRFLRAVGKAREKLCSGVVAAPTEILSITVKVDGKLIRVKLKDIIYVEGMREYVAIHTTNGRLVTFERMHQLEETLPSQQFMRIHKSYLIATSQVRALEGNQLDVAGTLLPVSRSRKEDVIRRIFNLE